MSPVDDLGAGYLRSTVTMPTANLDQTGAPLLSILRTGSDSSSEDELLASLAQRLKSLAGASSADIMSVEPETLALKASTDSPHLINVMRMGKGKGLCGRALDSASPTFIEKDATSDPAFVHYPGLEHRACQAVAALPLIERNEPLGVLFLVYDQPRTFKEADRRALAAYAQIATLRWATFRSAYLAGTQINRLGALSEVAKTLGQSPYLEEILQLLVNITAKQFNYKVCTVRLLDPERNELVLRATQAPAKAYQRKPAIKLGESIAGRAIAENRCVIVPDVAASEEYIGHDLAIEQGLRSMICVPLIIQDRPVGVMSCYTSEPHEFLPDEIKALETLAQQAAVSIEHAKLQVRNTLMQEMHHRVKNNLQQVASLLRLQLRQSHYKTLEEALTDSLARILAIAAVHDLLSREDLDHVGVRTIAEALVEYVRQSFLPPGKQIVFDVRGDDVHLNMTQATQVALVLNELIQNAVEHGFKHSDNGEIHVTVEDQDGSIGLWVSNSGDPLPSGFDVAMQSHLGLQIVENLSRALGGKFKMSEVLGWTVCEVKFRRLTSE
ncbi:MAG: GAF domain-containing protein [Fimbriimonadaceae bacterium]|nr:GAF domain-containing protein [Fimbriimonadaceae bacterium]